MKKIISLGASALCFLSAQVYAITTVDVLVLYTQEATQTLQGQSIDARIATYEEYTNRAYQNSNVDMRIRVVGMEQFDTYPIVEIEDPTVLTAFTTDPEAGELRDKYGADLVVLLNLAQDVTFPDENGDPEDFTDCGVAETPDGDSETGQFIDFAFEGEVFSAARLAYSMVGVDCDVTTFAHEIGHNMGLIHDIRNDIVFEDEETGEEILFKSIWPWARGYGVDNEFSTIMVATPESYDGLVPEGTPRREILGLSIQAFSNPRLTLDLCKGLPCGVDDRENDGVDNQGADAAGALNGAASQVAAFRETVVDECPESKGIEGNLIENSHFDQIPVEWISVFGLAEIEQSTITTDNCDNNVLAVVNRRSRIGNAFYSLVDNVQAGDTYRLQGKFGLSDGVNARDSIRFVIGRVKNGRTGFQFLPKLSVTGAELTAYDQEFTLRGKGEYSSLGLFVFGPRAGVDFVLDDISLVQVENVPMEN